MWKYLSILVVLLAILSHSETTLGQSNINGGTPRGDKALEGDGSRLSNTTENSARSQTVSKEATEEAKRLYKLGVTYGRGGLFKQASELFQRAVRLNPNYGDAHYGLGLAYFDQGRWEDAIQSFSNAIKINPKDKEAQAKLDEAYVMAGRNNKTTDQPQAEATAAKALSSNASSTSPQKNDAPAGAQVSLDVPAGSSANKSWSTASLTTDLTRVYRIGVGDVLDVRLSNEPATQSTLFTVTPSGLLEHPILPTPLQVSGLTVDEAKAQLEADLKRRAVDENPTVLIGVREYLSHAIIVSGLVKDPGTKLLRREAIPLYVVIADAQPMMEAGRATVIRHETGEAVIADLSKPTEMNLLVRPGDIITVNANPKQFFYVGGEVKAPGEVQFRAGLTLTQAILAAGGLSRESKQAQIAREGANGFLKSTRYKLKDINNGKMADPLIQPGDRITVEH